MFTEKVKRTQGIGPHEMLNVTTSHLSVSNLDEFVYINIEQTGQMGTHSLLEKPLSKMLWPAASTSLRSREDIAASALQ